MKYEELCKYVFSEQQVDWELHNFKSRKRQLVQAKQICIYLGRWFFNGLRDIDLTEPLGIERSGYFHAQKSVKSLMFSDKQYRTNMDKYLLEIRKRIKEEDIAMIEKLQEEELYRKKLLDTIDSMEIVAKVYCDIKGLKLTNK